MIVKSCCQQCLSKFVLHLEAEDMDLVKTVADPAGLSAPCPRLCGGRINLTGISALAHHAFAYSDNGAQHVSGKELFQAVKGLGLRDEIPKNPETVDALLKVNRVVGTVVEQDDGRIYLRELHLSNGLTIHLTSGLHGAAVFKVTKRTDDAARDHR